MKRLMPLVLLMLVNPVMAEENCLQPKTDYERGCAEVTNLKNLPTLAAINDCALITVDARSHWNASGLRLEKGKEYLLEVDAGDKWCDAGIVTDYKGWNAGAEGNLPGSGTCPDKQECTKCKPKKAVNGPRVNLGGVGNGFIKLTKWLRRNPDSQLFALIGLVKGELYKQEFELARQRRLTPKRDAEFCAYANDSSFLYGNNSGTLSVKIKRIK